MGGRVRIRGGKAGGNQTGTGEEEQRIKSKIRRETVTKNGADGREERECRINTMKRGKETTKVVGIRISIQQEKRCLFKSHTIFRS